MNTFQHKHDDVDDDAGVVGDGELLHVQRDHLRDHQHLRDPLREAADRPGGCRGGGRSLEML